MKRSAELDPTGRAGTAYTANRFDGERVRHILERAAAEQHRLNQALAETYSLAELQEMAAEAGIAPEALRAAIEQVPPDPAAAARRTAAGAVGRAVARRAAPWVPGRWSANARAAVVAGAAGLAALGVLLAFPAAAQVLLWVTILLLVLMALGAFPV